METMDIEQMMKKIQEEDAQKNESLLLRLNELMEKGKKGKKKFRVSSLTEKEEKEKIDIYRAIFPVDREKLAKLRKISQNLQRPDHYDDDAIHQSPITNDQLNLLDTVEKYTKVGYKLAFVAPEVEEVVKGKRQPLSRSYIQRKKYVEEHIIDTDESQTYKLDITTTFVSGKRPSASGWGIVYIIDVPEEELHAVTSDSVHSDLGVSEV